MRLDGLTRDYDASYTEQTVETLHERYLTWQTKMLLVRLK